MKIKTISAYDALKSIRRGQGAKTGTRYHKDQNRYNRKHTTITRNDYDRYE